MTPIGFPEHNKTLMPAPGTEDSVLPLVVHNHDGCTTSCWLLDPVEIEQVNQTGRIYLQVHAGKSSPPVSLHAFKPNLGMPSKDAPSPQEMKRRIEAGQCPMCQSEAGMISISTITHKSIKNWADESLSVTVEHGMPYTSCIACGCSVHLTTEEPPGTLDRAVAIAQEITGVPRKADETVHEYNDRLQRIHGPDWPQIYEQIKLRYFQISQGS